MVATLFYAQAIPADGESAVVDGDEGFHAATVRRLRPGEELMLSDGAGAVADCVVETVDKRSLSARVLARRAVPQPRPPVTVVQAIPKSERSELAVELATEAGADGFLAWQADRCVARWDGDRADKGLRRWRAGARSARAGARPISARGLSRAHFNRIARRAPSSGRERGLEGARSLDKHIMQATAHGGVFHEEASTPWESRRPRYHPPGPNGPASPKGSHRA